MILHVLLTLVLSQSVPPAVPAPVVLTGRVVTGAPAQPVAGAIVSVGAVNAITDPAGRFTLTVPGVAPNVASLRVTVSAATLMDASLDVTLPAGTLEVHLEPRPQIREEVVVSAGASESTVAPPTLVIAPVQVLSVAGSADNVFRVLQTLPGVSATDDFGSRLSVRGGGPDQNLTLMDGVEIHNPYRLFGLTSAFNPETIDRFELTAGAFGAKYGDRLSSILVVDNREGTTTRGMAGSAALSITDANLVLEGRLPKGTKGSWLVTGRRTYYDLFAERVTHEDFPSFNDLQTKIVWQSQGGQHLTLFGLRSRESTDATFSDNTLDAHFGVQNTSTNDVVSLTFSSPIGPRVSARTIASWYRFGDALDVDGDERDETRRSNTPGNDAFDRATIAFTRDVTVRDTSVRQEVTVQASSRQTLETGAEVHLLDTSWGWRIAGDRNANEANGSSVRGGAGLPDLLDSTADTARAGAWFEDEVRLGGRVRVAGGVRVDWNGISRETIAMPRVRALLTLAPRTTVRIAAGRYTQSPGYEKLLQKDYFVDLSNAEARGVQSERSTHLVTGLEHRFGASLLGRVEGYYKTFDRLMVGRRETPDETAARVAQYAFPPEFAWSVPTEPQITSVPTNRASGDAYGFDVYLQKQAAGENDRLSGWVSYTWGRAFIENYGRRYPFDYDRRHAISLVSTWRLSRRIDIGATLRVASGFPETQPIGVRVASEPAEDATAGAPGSLVPAYDDSGALVWTIDQGGVGNLNGSRLPVFARLDLRLTYMPSRSSRWQFYVEAINALNRENAGALLATLEYDPTSDRPQLTYTRAEGLPFLPSFGFRIRF